MAEPTSLYTAPAGKRELLMGNYALVRGMFEAGVRVATTYPGSPTPEIARAILDAHAPSLFFEYSTNEIVATEFALGAALAGHPSVVFMKSVGLNVASDAVVQLPLYELPGGMVVIVGDDPAAYSSQNEQDDRHFPRMAYIPMLEPSDAPEAKAMFKWAVEKAREHRTAVLIRVTTRVCHATMEVELGPLPDNLPEPEGVPKRIQVPIAKDFLVMKRRALERLDIFEKYAEEGPWNRTVEAPGEDVGFGIITGGAAYLNTRTALDLLGRGAHIFKLGLSYPLPRKRLVEFCKARGEVLVIEELDPVVETELKALAYEEGLGTKITGLGKKLRSGDGAFEAHLGELDPGRIAEFLAERLGREYPLEVLDLADKAPARLPQLCPGCGHRSAVYGTKMAVGLHGHPQADIGCHTMSYFPPYELGESLVCMGAGPSVAQGVGHVLPEGKVTSFLGDSTFFHAGIPGLINAVWNDHDVTVLLMDNEITAMTGHQPNPRSGRNREGPRPAIDPKAVLSAIGVPYIDEVEAWDIKAVREAVKKGLEFDGPAVVILKHPCMLYTTRAWKREGKMPPPYRVNRDKCRLKKTCIKYFCCPAFSFEDSGGVQINPELCIGCGCCAQICPVGAIEQDLEYERAY
ncbi:MAG TPA: thiamine pyrophosphate-dependent enzyme [bacterium]|nr:thiamine pyrophosphate-dependent enzyme [bacterium]